MTRAVRLCLVILSALVAFMGVAKARDGEPIEPPAELIRSDYWSRGSSRLFMSSRLEAGLVYAKPQVAVGYGRPFWSWVGVEAFGLTTNSFGGGFVGVRGALPFVSLSLGARDSYSYVRSYLPIKQHYTVDDVSRAPGEHARYVTLEAEAFAVAPVPLGYVLVAPVFYAVTDAPPGRYLYEESLRGIMKPPFIWALRTGYLLAFGHDDFVKVGGLFEVVGLPGRDETILRAGPAGTMAFTEHLDLTGTFSMVISSPDSLGLWHGPFGQIGLTYYWATGASAARE